MCDAHASCVGAVPACVCDEGYSGDGETCALSVATSCQDVLDRGESTGTGIYEIDPDGAGGAAAYDVYCDMTTADGGWTLLAYWVAAPAAQRTYNDVSVKGVAMNPYSQSPGTYPVPPPGTLNTFDEQLLRSGHGSWTSIFGAYVTYDMFTPASFPLSSFPGRNAVGSAITLYSHGPPWSTSSAATTYYAVWNVPNNNGVCGGASVCANPVCPALHVAYGCHFDFSSAKLLFGR